MLEVTEEEFRLIVSQWREKKSVIHVWVLYHPGDRMRQFSCVMQDISETAVILITEDGWLHIMPFGNAKFSYDTPDNAPSHIKASVSAKMNSVLRLDWLPTKDMWLMYESKDALPGAVPVTDCTSN